MVRSRSHLRDSPNPSRAAGSARAVVRFWLGAGATALACDGMSCDQTASRPVPLTTPSHDHSGMRSQSGTSSADRWYRDIVVVVAHAK